MSVGENVNSLQLTFEIYKSLFDSSPDANYVLDLDGYFIYMNEATSKLTGYSMEELPRMSFSQVMIDIEIEKIQQYYESIKKGNIEKFETTFRTKSGKLIELLITAAPIIIDEKIQGIIGIAKDMTERKNMERKLAVSQNQLQNITDSINVCLWSWDYVKKDHLFISPGCKKICGYTHYDFHKDPYLWKKIIFPEDLEALEIRRNFFEKHKPTRNEYRIMHAQGEIRWVSDYRVPIFDQSGQLIRLDGVISDITQQKQGEEKLHFFAYHDTLTGLPNRMFFMKKVKEALSLAHKNNHKVAIVYLDVNKFKEINDSLGHDLGDKLLQMIAHRLKDCIHPEEMISRIDGDEFAFLLEGIHNFTDVYPFVKRINQAFMKPFSLKINDFVLKCSMGASFFPDHGKSSRILIKHADQAMYFAKKAGSDELQIYHHEISKALSRKIFLGQSLYRALDYNEISIYYQPIMNVKENKIEGMEALARWNHTQEGMISPAEFIPIAEESGFIVTLGEWILKKACFDNKKLRDAGLPPIYTAVNISARQLQQKDFLQKVKQILNESQLDPKFLKIEITESTALINVKEVIDVFDELGRMGIEISIDDFGTGFSALSYLKRLPINTLKIDQSFIRDINNNSNQEAIIQAILAIAKSLRINVIAEGVEKSEQIRFLKNIGCDALQGFFYSRPVPFESLQNLLPDLQG